MDMKGSVRRARWLVATLALCLVASACSGEDTTDEPGDTGSTTETGTAAAGDGETTSDDGAEDAVAADPEAILTFGSMQGEDYDPIRGTTACELTQLNAIFDTLVRFDSDRQLVPSLAEDWRVDGSTLTLNLRDGVTFQDGTPFDAEAVVFNLERALNDEQSTIGGTLYMVQDIQAVDDTTVEIALDPPAAGPLLSALAGRAGMMASPTAVEEAGSSDAFSQAPVGAGMYAIDGEWLPRESMSVRAWDGYWDTEAQALGGIDFVEIDFPAKVNALKSGEADMLQVQDQDVETVASDPNLRVVSDPIGQYRLFLMNETLPPFDDVRVRQALFHAIDEDAIAAAQTFGVGEGASQPFLEESLAYNPAVEDMYPYDPERARELLEEAGYTEPVPFEAVIGGTATSYVQQGELVQAQVNEAGFDMTLTLIDSAEAIPMIYRAGPDETGEAQASPFGMFETFDPDELFRARFLSDGSWNAGGNEPDGLRELLDEAAAAVDPETRSEIYQDATMLVMEQALDSVPLYFQLGHTAYADHVGGVQRGESHCLTDFRGVYVTQGETAIE